mmetsp:Transcript_67037/g.125254  ORF Transcript_67037/g.125254 Transcript_67037/m.125254 type:complete len:316 (-) Transcript_67037:88-1035(-)
MQGSTFLVRRLPRTLRPWPQIRHVGTKQTVDLGPVQTTLLIPLLGRAMEARKPNALLKDPKALEVVDSLDYDFSHWQGQPNALLGTIFRTLQMDEDVKMFLEKYPTGTIVEVGCGLNTRYERIDNGQATWIDIDMPDAIELRKKYFNYDPSDARRKMIGASIVDEGKWLPVVEAAPRPVCFVSEAAIIYVDEAHVRTFIKTVANRFDGSWLIVDTVSARLVDRQKDHPLMKHLPPEGHFCWRCDEPKPTIEGWTDGKLQQLSQRTFADIPVEWARQVGQPWSFLRAYMPWLLRIMSMGYNLNVFVGQAGVAGKSG